jgi:myo-inositol-1(or 4)-monophosphatase
MSQPRLTTARDWLDVFERLAMDVRREAGPLLGTAAGGAEIGTVCDRTLEVDQRAENVVLNGLRQLADGGPRFSVLSEEVGLVELGAEYPRVVVDPIDGSPNARRGLRIVGVMLSLIEGPSAGDVGAGVTVDLTSGERWSVVRGEGVTHDSHPLRPMRFTDDQHIDVLGQRSAAGRAFPNLATALTMQGCAGGL